MAVGDIHFLSDQQYMNFKITSEKDAKDSNDAVLVSDIATLSNTVSTIGQNNSVINQNLISLGTHLDTTVNEVNIILQDPITTEEYKADTNNYLTFFPNIPANLSKTVYYLNLHNLLLSVNNKLNKTIKFLEESSGDISSNQNFIKLNELMNITFPIFKNNVTNLINVSNSGNDTNEKSFKDLVTSIKSLQANTSVQIYTDTQTTLDAKSDNEQTNLTVTRYYDKDQNKYYKMYIESGLLKFEETLHPLFKTYSALMTTLQNGMFNISVEKTDEEILSRFTTYKSLFHTTIDNRIYSVINNYIYIYDNESKSLLAKIKYQPTILFMDMYKDSEYETLRSMYNQDEIFQTYIYKKTDSDFHPYFVVMLNLMKQKNIVNPDNTSDYYNTIYYMQHSSHFYMKKCGNTLVFGEMFNNKIMILNLSIIEENIKNAQKTNSVYIGDNDWSNSNIITFAQFTNEPLYNTGSLASYNISSLNWNSDDNILYIALSTNFVYEIGISNEKTSISFDGDIITNYNFGMVIGSTYRFGSTLSEQNLYIVRSVYFDSQSKKLFGVIDSNINLNQNIKTLVYIKINNPNITYVAKTLNFKESPLLRVNNLELKYDQTIDNYDIKIESMYSGYRNYQYIRNNDLENLNFINKRVLLKYTIQPDGLTQIFNYRDSKYSLCNDSIVLHESSRYIIYLFNGLQYTRLFGPVYEPTYRKKYSIRMYDKKFNMWSFNKSISLNDIAGHIYNEYDKNTIINDSYIDDTVGVKAFTDLDEKNTHNVYTHNNLNFINVSNIKETKNSFELKLSFESLIRPVNSASIKVYGENTPDYCLIDLSDDLTAGDELTDNLRLKYIKNLGIYVSSDLDQFRNLLDVKITLTKDD